MKLYEITESINSMVAEYVGDMSDPKICDIEFGSSDFNELCTEAGNCAMISNHFVEWLRNKKITATAITGYQAINKGWPKNANVSPGSGEDAHTVVLINGNTIVDLTAKQFDTKAKFPKISTYAEFKMEWEEVD